MLKMKVVETISEVLTRRNYTAYLPKEGIRKCLLEAAAFNSHEADSDRTVMVWIAMMVLEMRRHHQCSA